MICGVDIGGTYTRIGRVDAAFNVHDFKRVKTASIVDDFSAFLQAYIQTHAHVSRIVMGFPGVVNPHTKTVLKIANQPHLESLDIQALETFLNLPIDINKDTYHLFMVDQKAGHLKTQPNILGFYLGTGLGHVIYLNHQIHYGDTYAAAELGHQAFRHSQAQCPCGLKGCFETKVSGHYLTHVHATYFNDIPFAGLFKATEHPHYEMLTDMLDAFAFIIASQMHILNVSHIIIGGGVPHMTDFPTSYLTQKIHTYIRHEALKPISIYWADARPEKGVIGAAMAGYQKELP